MIKQSSKSIDIDSRAKKESDRSVSKSLKKSKAKKSGESEGKSGVSLKESIGEAVKEKGKGKKKGDKSLSRSRKNLSNSPDEEASNVSKSKSKTKGDKNSTSKLLKSELLKDTTKDKIKISEEEVNFLSKMATVKIGSLEDVPIPALKTFGFINSIAKVPRSNDFYLFGDDGIALIINLFTKTSTPISTGIESKVC